MRLAQFTAFQMAIVGLVLVAAREIYQLPNLWVYGIVLMVGGLIMGVFDEMTEDDDSKKK